MAEKSHVKIKQTNGENKMVTLFKFALLTCLVVLAVFDLGKFAFLYFLRKRAKSATNSNKLHYKNL